MASSGRIDRINRSRPHPIRGFPAATLEERLQKSDNEEVMKPVLTLISAMVLATMAIVRGQAAAAADAPNNLTGTWNGTARDRFVRNNTPDGMNVTWVLTQTGDTISGTVVTDSLVPGDGSCSSCHRAKSGTVSGTVSGNSLSLTMNFPGGPGDITSTCTATFSGTASGISANAFTALYSGGDSCENLAGESVAFANGTLDLVRVPTATTSRRFQATLVGAEQVPPVSTSASGTGIVVLNSAEDQITVNMSFAGLTSPANAAHIHGPAGVGSNAGVLFPFSAVPAAMSGSIPQQTFAITAAQVAQLKAGQFYFNVHSDTNPGGEIRGQIRMAPFVARLTGAAQVPPVSSPGTGAGTVLLNAANDQITVNLSFAGLTSPANMAHIHGPAGVGANAGILFPFTGVPVATSGTLREQTFTISAVQVAQLEAGQFYFNVHTNSNAGGEIRGQILMDQEFGTTLTGSEQVPPVMSPGTGTGRVRLNATEDQITVNMSFAGLTSPANAAHIHGPAGVGANAGVLFGLSGVPAATAGSIPEQTFVITAAQVAQLKTGQFYFNIHTDTNTGGEIRGQIGALLVPTITTQPTDLTVNAGQNASFSVAAVGTPAPTTQWQVSTDNSVTWTNVTPTATNGATTPTLTVAATTLLNGARYRSLVTNLGATVVTRAALLTVNSITANPVTMSFGATKAGAAGALQNVTPPQDLTVLTTGTPGNWTASANQAWVQITNGTGTGNGRFTVGISDPTNVLGAATTASATVTLTAATSGLTTTVPLTLTILQSGRSAPPFGAFDTPVNGTTGMQGSFAVTGWALDDTAINRVEIWRDRAPGETTPVYPGPGPGTGKIFIANALFITGARPDVETAFASAPQANRAGWGYLLLSWGLFNQGNGPFTLYAFAFDQEGQFTTLGTKAITANNANANRPFGALDVPGLGDTKSGTFFNFGWALTPNATPSCVITNGNVFMAVDSGALQAVNYGDLRPDIAAGFPGFSNSNNAGGAFALDTTTLTNGVHQIGWYVVDSCGRADGIGSRFFTVLNGGSGSALGLPTAERGSESAAQGSELEAASVDAAREPVEVRRGGDPAALVWPTATGTRVVPVAQGERVEVVLPRARASYVGSQVINGERRALPLGSSLDAGSGTFYWQPAAGFLGSYDLEFTTPGRTERPLRVRAVVGPPMRMTIDAPQAGAVVASSFLVGGWALDLAAEDGSGIDTVHVWAYPLAGGAPRFLGVAAIGDARPDVALTYGDQFTRSSYNLWVNGLRRGTYDLVVYAHRAATGTFDAAQVVRVTVR
jgi:hypothetical protein